MIGLPRSVADALQSVTYSQRALAYLQVDAGLTLVISLHQVSLARRYCTRVLALRDGELVYDGPSAALTPSFLQRLYGTAAEELLHDDHPFAAPGAGASP